MVDGDLAVTVPMRRMLEGDGWLFSAVDTVEAAERRIEENRPDLVIIDLEDAVSADHKVAAREALISESLDPRRVVVRVNPAGTADHAADVVALRETDYRTVMLAKTEHVRQFELVSDWDVVALLETPAGVVNAAELAAAPGVVAVMWGAEDLVAAMGGRSSRFPDGRYRDVAAHARSSALLAAHAAGRHAVDSVYIDIKDLAGLSQEALDAAASGFAYKACIHPSQAEVVRAGFRPSQAMVTRARRIIELSRSSGVVSIDGQMIDAPLIRQAERVLLAAETSTTGAAVVGT